MKYGEKETTRPARVPRGRFPRQKWPKLLTEPGVRARSGPDERPRPRDAGRCRRVARPPLRGNRRGSARPRRAADAALASSRRHRALLTLAAHVLDDASTRQDGSRAREGRGAGRRRVGRSERRRRASRFRAEPARPALSVPTARNGSSGRRSSGCSSGGRGADGCSSGAPSHAAHAADAGRSRCSATGASSRADSVALAFRGAVCQAPPPSRGRSSAGRAHDWQS
jgi:hypothetical protein